MEKDSYYVPVETVIVPGHGHTEFQGINIEIPNAPFLPSKIGNLSTVGIETGDIPENPKQALRKISTFHGRSYEYSGGQKIVWADEFGNIYTTLNTKGNNATNPAFYLDRSSEAGFNVFGLQTSVGIARQLKASEILRRAGIETEAITHVIEPLALPFDGKLIPIEEFKLKLKEDAIKRTDPGSPGADILLSQSLANVAFFETVRATQVNERIADFAIMPDAEKTKAIQNAFFYTNLYERSKAKKDPSHAPILFDVQNPESIELYLNSYLPTKIGRNYAKLHGLGLVHKFSYISNVSLTGSIVDLDSIQGEALGDNPEVIDYEQDLDSFRENVGDSNQKNPFIPDINLFVANLTNSYISEAMRSTQQIDIHLRNIEAVVKSTDFTKIDPGIITPASHHDYLEYMLDRAPIPSFDIVKIARQVADQTYHDQNGSELSIQNKFVIFREILTRLCETGYDKTLRRKMNKFRLFQAVFSALGEKLEDEKPEEIYKEVTARKTQKVLDAYAEPLQDLFGTDKLGEDIPQTHDQAYVKAAYEVAVQLGWANDITKYAFDIQHLLELGETRTGRNDIRDSVLDNVLSSFTSQSGISFPWQESVNRLISEFHNFDQQQGLDLKRISDVLKTKGLSKLSLTDIDRYFILKEYFGEKFAQDRYVNFVVQKIKRWEGMLEFRQILFNACENAENANTINNWFASQAGLAHIDSLHTDKLKRIDRSAEKRLAPTGTGEQVDKKWIRNQLMKRR